MQKITTSLGEIVLPGILLTAAAKFGQGVSKVVRVGQGSWVDGISNGMQYVKTMPLEYTLGIVFIGVVVFLFAKLDQVLSGLGKFVLEYEKSDWKNTRNALLFIAGLVRVSAMTIYAVLVGWYALGTFEGAISDVVEMLLWSGVAWAAMCFLLGLIVNQLSGHHSPSPTNTPFYLFSAAVPAYLMTAVGAAASFYACCPFISPIT